MNKIVYIIGAGASAAVKLPMQSSILNKIFSITKNDLPENIYSNNNSSIFNIPEESQPNTLTLQFKEFQKSRRELALFILNNFSRYEADENTADEILYEKVSNINISLEDLFTIFDKASFNKEYILSYSSSSLSTQYKHLCDCIIFIIELYSQKSNSDLYKRISEYFVDRRLATNIDDDPFSIITLNWDTLLDNNLFVACNNKLSTGKKILPDYCFYNYDVDGNIPCTKLKAKGYHNIKLLKLHGSINWLLCKNCGRILTSFKEDIAFYNIDPGSSKYSCSTCCSIGRESDLKSVLITPTFIKDFNNLHLKNIWFNASIELSEASEVVFIGYSLPDADYEFRYLLKRSLRKDAKVTVVLHGSDDPTYKNKLLDMINTGSSTQNELSIDGITGIGADNIKNILNKSSYPSERYLNLLSNHDIRIQYNGIEGYFNEILKK